MALITSRTSLSQGASTSVSNAVFAAGTGADIRIHSAAANLLPALAAGAFFEVRDHSLSQNNGLYQVVTVTTSTDDYECDKVTGSAPSTAAGEAITTLGSTGTPKSIHFDTGARLVYALEKGNLSSDGMIGQAIYSFMMQEWKDDNFLIANAPFPMFAIDSDAGKYIMGQDASGNNNGWNWADDAVFSIRTRKLLRNMGWNEVDANGNVLARYVGVVTLGSFEDPTNDNAYYYFGSDQSVDNSTNFTFNGPVNEAVKFYEEIGNPATFTIVDGGGSADTCTRASGSFITDGFVVGGKMTLRACTTAANNGSYTITGVAALTLTFATGSFNTGQADPLAQVSVNNADLFTLGLRVRDGDTNGKTFAQANLTSAGKTALGNFVYAFPLANATDLKIEETDANIDANTPYTGMTLTYYATPQAKTGLVGGSFNFGIVIDANNGTSQEVYEFIQRELRRTSDIDDGGGTIIGRMASGLMRFVGDSLEVGSTDGGLTFPVNPIGGGTGVFIDNLNAASKNSVSFYDNLNAVKAFPETIPVTCDFNVTLESDTAAEFDLFYDRTIRTVVADLDITSGAPATITSAGSSLPTASIAAGRYVRISGLTGADADMNGIYQIQGTPAASSWDVVRYDGQTIVSVTTPGATVDQYPINSPDAIIVDTDSTLTGTTIAFVSPDTITDSGNGLAIFASGERIRITGSDAEDGIYTVDTSAAGTLTLIEQTIATDAAGPSVTITQVASGTAAADFSFSYDFDGNVQGGRTVSTTAYVQGKAIGATTAQYTESTVQTIETGTPRTIPFVSQQERNYA